MWSIVAICRNPDDSHNLASRNTCRLQDEPLTSTTAPATQTSPTSANPVAWIVALLATIIAAVLILRIPPLAHPWPQNYDPTGRWWLSALLAALPVVVLLGSLALLHMKAHYSALLGLATSLICSICDFRYARQPGHQDGCIGAATACCRSVGSS